MSLYFRYFADSKILIWTKVAMGALKNAFWYLIGRKQDQQINQQGKQKKKLTNKEYSQAISDSDTSGFKFRVQWFRQN